MSQLPESDSVAVESDVKAPRAPVDRPVIWWVAWLGVVLAGCKLAQLKWPEEGMFRYVVNAVVASHQDLLLALGLGMIGWGAMRLMRRKPRLGRVVYVTWVGLCVVTVVYAVVSVRIYQFLRTPLTYRLIYLADDMSNMRSSVGLFLSWGMISALVGVPLGYLAAGLLSSRWLKPRTNLAWRGMTVAAIAGVFYSGYFGHKVYHLYWHWREDHRLAESPHWTLLASTVKEIGGSGAPRLKQDFPAEFVEDFLPVSERKKAMTEALPAGAAPRNVIVVVLESTAARYLSLYGSKYETTPRMQAEAAHALVVESCYAHVGMTASSLLALTTSQYPSITFRQDTQERPDLVATTLPQLLKQRGYRTGFFTSADIHYANQERFLQRRGFDLIRDKYDLPGPQLFSWGVEDRQAFEDLNKWIDQAPNQPFAAVLWTTQTHHPYALAPGRPVKDFLKDEEVPEREALSRYLNILYDTDRQVGELLDGLRARGLADDTLVVITGDHGEGFGWPHATFAHGFHLYDENVRVPLMLWNPRLFAGGKREKGVVSHIDITPTIAHLMGVPADGTWQGSSLFDKARRPRAYFFAADHDYLLGVREGNFKYIYNATTAEQELFDLETDPLESKNIAASRGAECNVLRQRVAAWLSYQERKVRQK